MRLNFTPFDGRRKWTYAEVIDEDTSKVVGYITPNGTGFGDHGGIKVSLFDNKYYATLRDAAECQGFVKGVETVLSHMTNFTYRDAKSSAA
jgi:hypothetical protein